jgi:chemotaxis protein methyltransferase CheR
VRAVCIGEDDTVNTELELSERNFRRFRDLIYDHSRINLGEQKQALVRTRLAKVMRQNNISSYDDYYDYVVADATGLAVRELINAISTNLTSFFRETKHFEFLSKQYLPELVATCKAERRKRIRAWSAGCSTGEEPYTLAIILLEAIPDISSWDVKILATDIDSNVLETGRRGLYRKKQIEPMPPMFKGKYLTKEGRGEEATYRVSDAVRRLVAFRQLNLMRKPYPFAGPFDIIFCRNVMIYFNRETQEELVNRFYELLRPGGALFVGHSESLTGVQHRFRYVQPTVYRR